MQVASSALIVLCLVCVWMVLQMLVLGGISEDRSQSLLYAKFRSELALATAPVGALDYNGQPVQPGAPVALLSIPAIGVNQVVVDGTASGDLLAGPGHLRSTMMPGQQGYSAIAGRASTYGAPFADLGQLKVGDPITVTTGQGTVTYRVTDLRHAGDHQPQPISGTQGMLTLITAGSSGFASMLRPHDVFYVDAIAPKALAAGVTPGMNVPSSEQPMARDSGALPLLTLLLAGLAGAVLAIAVLRRRFSAVLVWVLATPVVIALAWAVTDTVMRLLPNLM